MPEELEKCVTPAYLSLFYKREKTNGARAFAALEAAYSLLFDRAVRQETLTPDDDLVRSTNAQHKPHTFCKSSYVIKKTT